MSLSAGETNSSLPSMRVTPAKPSKLVISGPDTVREPETVLQFSPAWKVSTSACEVNVMLPPPLQKAVSLGPSGTKDARISSMLLQPNWFPERSTSPPTPNTPVVAPKTGASAAQLPRVTFVSTLSLPAIDSSPSRPIKFVKDRFPRIASSLFRLLTLASPSKLIRLSLLRTKTRPAIEVTFDNPFRLVRLSDHSITSSPLISSTFERGSKFERLSTSKSAKFPFTILRLFSPSRLSSFLLYLKKTSPPTDSTLIKLLISRSDSFDSKISAPPIVTSDVNPSRSVSAEFPAIRSVPLIS